MENEKFVLDTETGSIECEILLKFYSEKFQKNYLVYTDQTTDIEGDLNVFISSYNDEENSRELFDIKDQNELTELTKKIDELWSTYE